MISHYSMLIQWSDLDQVFVVTLPEFGGPKTHGDTYEEAVKNGVEVLELLMEDFALDDSELPEPNKFQMRKAKTPGRPLRVLDIE